MKNHLTKCLCAAFALIAAICLAQPAQGVTAASGQQPFEVTGTIVSPDGQPLVGATVVVAGDPTRGTTSLADGSFRLTVPNVNAVLEASYLGYETQLVPIEGRTIVYITLIEQALRVGDVVVIGYGTQRRSDLTGSVASITSEDFNTGLVSSPEQLINGKIAGVQILSNSGSPSAGSTIRIRGGASLNASNDPLIVLDGVPLETGGISGNDGNFLSLINPNDIETMTVLKDASSTAIYGSRASNGVIIITTKKGNGKLSVNASTTQSVQQRTRTVDMLSTEEFRSVIMRDGSAAQQALLGNADTDWKKEVFRLAYGSDNNVSVSGSIAPNLPFRVSAGYYIQNGIVRTDRSERATGNISLSPSLFRDHLRINLNVKGAYNHNRFANSAPVIYNAGVYNPTLPVYRDNGDYYEALSSNGVPDISGQTMNPLALVEQYDSRSNVSRVLGNFDVDYRMHFLPELRAHLTLGYDGAEGKGTIMVPETAALYYSSKGRDYSYGPQKSNNQLLTFYLNYNKEIEAIKSRIDVTAGYDYQKWMTKTPQYDVLDATGGINSTVAAIDQRHVLLSFYGRLNYTLNNKYILTATVRRDGSSRFSKDNRWSTFPSVALAWRISGENFLTDSKILSNLKLRLSYGQTGQQDGIGNYSYIPQYTISQDGAQYQFGNEFYYTYRPEAYVSNLKWETTDTYNIGLDWGLLDDCLTGSVDYYNRKTRDLLATVPSPAGSNFAKQITTNVGNMKSEGVEFTINATPIRNDDWQWDLSFNATWQSVKITNLKLADGGKANETYVGYFSGTSSYLQVMKEGYAPYTFYLYKQVYDKNGKPIEGMYADLDGNGQINSGDLYCANSPFPDLIMGFSTNLRYRNWSLGFALRANIGNYAYNGNAMNSGAYETVTWNAYQINNMSTSYLDTRFQSRQPLSDYYLENASFLKMDNITLAYDLGNITKWCRMRLSAMVQNVFTITKYSGVDPEIYGGIESSFYPRARVFSLGIGFDF